MRVQKRSKSVTLIKLKINKIMEKIIFVLSCIFTISSISYSQLPSSYPYKSIIDQYGYIYMTGDTTYPDGSKDFVMRKFTSQGIRIWRETINNPYFDDKGLDIVVDENVNRPFVYATGFIIDQFGIEKLIVVKRDKDFGTLIWEKKYIDLNNYASKGFGIALDNDGEIYVTGYVKNKFNEKDIINLNYFRIDGNILWEDRYSNGGKFGDDIGYDIITDNNYVYVIGSAYNGSDYLEDIVLLNYKLNGQDREVDLLPKGKTIDIPTGFIVSGPPIHQSDKSRISLTSISERPEFNPPNLKRSEYLTMTYNGGTTMDLEWMKTFSNEQAGENVATSIDADGSGNVYVTGYSYSARNGFDYGTIKYNNTGGYGWGSHPVQFYDSGRATDKASSVKVRGNLVYVTGSSQLANGGFRTIQYEQDNNGNMQKVWQNDFSPNFADEFPNNKAAQINIDAQGNVIVLTMQWTASGNSQYAMVKYSEKGDVMFVIDYNEQTDNQTINNNSVPENLTKENFNYTLSQNYPNPFNPSTIINYSIPSNVKGQTSNVNLVVYDALGRVTATLVNEYRESGSHRVEFDGSKFSSGIYFYELKIDGVMIDIKRMLLVK